MSKYWEQKLGTGIACYSDESGKIELVGFKRNPPRDNPIPRLLRLRRFIQANSHPGMTIKRSQYGLGWLIGHTSTNWTLWTIYLDQSNGFSLFRAIPELWKGYDIDDEKLVVQTDDWVVLKSVWDSEWRFFEYGESD